jgi:molybdopterin synthase sulfur carrier subunit
MRRERSEGAAETKRNEAGTEVAVTFYIPGPLRVFSEGLQNVEIETSPTTVREALEVLCRKYPGIRDRLINEEGRLREHINIFVGDENIRETGDFSTRVPPGAEISIIPAVSGG